VTLMLQPKPSAPARARVAFSSSTASVRRDVGRGWLATECFGGEVLWALNEPHLDYLERSSLTPHETVTSLPSRQPGLAYNLPMWMQLAENRRELLGALRRLRLRLL
jgi:hypothetical protein